MPRTKKAQPQTKAVKKESNAAIIADAKPTEDSSAAALTAAQPSTVVEKKEPAKRGRRKKAEASVSVPSAEPETAAAEDQAKIPGPAEKKLTERPEVKTTETVKEAPVVPDTFMNPPENAADTTSETSSPAPISETEKKPAKRGRKKKSESPEVSKAVKPVKKEISLGSPSNSFMYKPNHFFRLYRLNAYLWNTMWSAISFHPPHYCTL